MPPESVLVCCKPTLIGDWHALGTGHSVFHQNPALHPLDIRPISHPGWLALNGHLLFIRLPLHVVFGCMQI
jgi:hypothetical protein